ncbi:MAG: GyrI-like domain-containing protein [Calditrichota bacterium]
MKKVITFFALLALAGLLTCALAQTETTPPPMTKAEMIGQIEIKLIPPIKVISAMEKAADYAPEGGFKDGMDGAGLAYEKMMTSGFGKLGGWIQAGNQPMGPAMAMFFEDPEQTPTKDLTCKLMFPVGPDAKAAGDLVVEELPEMQAAVVQYKGPYEGSADVWHAIDKWVIDNGYDYNGAPMEVYIKGPGDQVEPSEFLTEIRVPVKKKEGTEPKE